MNTHFITRFRRRGGAGVLVAVLTLCGSVAAAEPPTTHAVVVEDFERPFDQVAAPPAVWVVNIPNDAAAVESSTEHPSGVAGAGGRNLKLHYRFTGAGQYLGVAVPLQILTPIHAVRWLMDGDASGSGYALYLTDAGGETHKFRGAGGSKIDWSGWRDVSINLDAPHETWGGDKNGRIDYPLKGLVFEVSHGGAAAVEGDLRFDAVRVDSEAGALQTLGGEVKVASPAYGAAVEGETTITLAAPGFETVAVSGWKPGGRFGSRFDIATVSPDGKGRASFVFRPQEFPHGPITLTLTGTAGTYTDRCYLQLYNRGGKSWNEGIPKGPPPAAAGMKLVFADDFDKPPSISATDPKATYYSHKPPDGRQDFSTLPFSDFASDRNPFKQIGTYLRIRAGARKNSAGLLSSIKPDGSGVTAAAPCYFECRFIAPNATGTWPAFWLLSDPARGRNAGETPVDELDIIEAYGGEGPGEPNALARYMVTPHAWNQGDAGKTAEAAAVAALHNPIDMKRAGIPSAWYEAPHTYGCKITATETIYYCDDIEVGRHATLAVSKQSPFFFLINLATGGGWPVDLWRYDGRADMYVDYVRVYQGGV